MHLYTKNNSQKVVRYVIHTEQPHEQTHPKWCEGLSDEDLRLIDKGKATQTFLGGGSYVFPKIWGCSVSNFGVRWKIGVYQSLHWKKKKEDRDVGLPNVQIMCASFEYLENVPAPLKGNKIGVVVPKEVTSQTI